MFVLLLARCFYLQHIRHDHYCDISLKQQQGRVPLQPQRGIILDSQGRVLAASNKIQTVYADPAIIKDPKDVANQLAEILNAGADDDNLVGAHEICRMIMESKSPRYIRIAEDVDIVKCRKARKIYGIGVESKWIRHYPMGPLTSHVVGFTSKDNRGLEGVELEFDKELAGECGQRVFLADSSRRPIILKDQSVQLKDGVGIILTLDATIQQFAREELMARFKEYEAEAGTAIVMDPKSGAILAMVSLPDFEPSNPGASAADTWRNRAITDQFEPGSIMKPIAAAVGMDTGVVNKSTVIYCEDGNYHGKGFGQIREYRYHRYGNMTVKQILIKSSNVGMAKIGQKLGKKRLHDGLALFGFGKKTGIDLPGEVSGVLWPVKYWTGYSETRVAYGQEITATALQMVRALSMLANGGKSIRPYLIKAIVNRDGKIVKLKEPVPPVGYVVKPEVAKWMIEDALSAVVNEGTGKRAKLDKWQVFGKTGTANIALQGKRGFSKDNYVASFIAGAPAEDPRIVVLVSIRKPNKSLGKGYTGGAVSSTAVRNIMEKTLTYLEKQEQ